MPATEQGAGAGTSWLTTADLCARLRISRMTLHRWCKAGYLPRPVRPTGAGHGRPARWLAREVEAFEARLAEAR